MNIKNIICFLFGHKFRLWPLNQHHHVRLVSRCARCGVLESKAKKRPSLGGSTKSSKLGYDSKIA